MARVVKILAVDDDTVSLELIARTLRRTEVYEVLTATSAHEGMRIAEEHLPSLVIIDQVMPGEDGITFCRKLKAHPRLTQSMIMLLTSATETEIKIKALKAGADDYSLKPFHPDELTSKVQSLLRIKALNDELRAEKLGLEGMYTAMQGMVTGVVDLLTHMIGLRVPNASDRAARASGAARWIGERLGIKEEQLEALEITARIHEIGKITMPDGILTAKRQDLTADDRETIMQFPLFGQMLVGSVPQLKGIGTWLRHQMENFDGTGYPDRLMEEEIPLASRILRVVNLLEERAAEGASSTAELQRAVEQARGTILDPRVVRLMGEYLMISENPSWLEGKRRIDLRSIKEGMVIAIDLCTASGIKLLPKDTRLTSTYIARILSHHHSDPIVDSVYVYE